MDQANTDARRVSSPLWLRLSLVLPFACAGQAWAISSPVEQFKDFVSSPPVIESLVYWVKLPPVKGTPPPIEDGLKFSTNFTHFHARWQPQAFFFREIPSLGNLQDHTIHGQAAFIFGAKHWILDTTFQPTATFWIDQGAGPVHGQHNPVFFVASTLQEWLSIVLNMGVHHLRVGSIKWQGNSFQARSHLRHIRVQGALTASNLYASELKLVYDDTDSHSSHVIRYSYTTNKTLGFLPTEIRHYFHYQGREVELGQIRILELKVGQTPLGEEMFAPDAFLNANRMARQVFTNESLFAVNRAGNLVAIPRSGRAPELPELQHASLFGHGIIYSFFAMALATFVVLVRRAAAVANE